MWGRLPFAKTMEVIFHFDTPTAGRVAGAKRDIKANSAKLKLELGNTQSVEFDSQIMAFELLIW